MDGLTSPAANTAWLRPLEYYTKSLAQAGFAITGLTEPHPSQEMIADDDWWRTSFTRPLFLLIPEVGDTLVGQLRPHRLVVPDV